MVVADSRRVPRVPRYSGARHEPNRFHIRGCHPLWPVFPDDSVSGSVGNSPALNRAGPTTPIDPKTHRFGLIRVRSPLLAKSLNCFLFLQVLRWFTSLSQLSNTALSAQWVPPFGDLRINACLRLPEAYRSLPRPSSPSVAKASTVCP